MAERQLNLYATYTYSNVYFGLSAESRRAARMGIAEAMGAVAEVTNFYNVFPTRANSDILIWSAWGADENDAVEKAFTGYAEALEPYANLIAPVQTLWGFTRVSTYSRGKSAQDMDPFEGDRSSYFIAYPFSKSKEWYLMSMDARQGQMNEHIKIGKQYTEIKQLLLYSFGLQDQEFVVAYETENLVQFSELVNALRSTEGRRHTSLDTPIVTGIHRTVEEFVR